MFLLFLVLAWAHKLLLTITASVTLQDTFMEQSQTTMYFGHTAIGSSKLHTEALALISKLSGLNVIQQQETNLKNQI